MLKVMRYDADIKEYTFIFCAGMS